MVKGKVLDANDAEVSAFTTNINGISKFTVVPEDNGSHRVVLDYLGKTYSYEINNVAKKGIILELKDTSNEIVISFHTNDATFPLVNGKGYTLAIHNGQKINTMDLTFEGKKEVVKRIPREALHAGINIFTLFDANNNPLLERQFFNYQGLSFETSQTALLEKKRDSIWVSLPYKNRDPETLSNLSISVLPAETVTYKHQHNLPSYVLLAPYVRGTIENASYYFNNIDTKKMEALDMLLLTQGWSSYDWGTIFNAPPDYDYDFEKGISYVANVNSISGGQFFIFPNANRNTEVVTLAAGENSFERNGLMPLSDETIRIGRLKENGKMEIPSVYLQFSPSQVPELVLEENSLLAKPNYLKAVAESRSPLSERLKQVEQLEEVVVTKTIEDTRIEKIRRSTLGKIEVFDTKKRQRYQNIANYLSQRGFEVDDNNNYFIGEAPENPNDFDKSLLMQVS